MVSETSAHSPPSTGPHSPISPHSRLTTPPGGPWGHALSTPSPVAVSGQSKNPNSDPEFSSRLQTWGTGSGVVIGVLRGVGVASVGVGVTAEVKISQPLYITHENQTWYVDVWDQCWVSTPQLVPIPYQIWVYQVHENSDTGTGAVPHVGAQRSVSYSKEAKIENTGDLIVWRVIVLILRCSFVLTWRWVLAVFVEDLLEAQSACYCPSTCKKNQMSIFSGPREGSMVELTVCGGLTCSLQRHWGSVGWDCCSVNSYRKKHT